MYSLVHDLVLSSAERWPDAVALRHRDEERCYAALAAEVRACASGLLGLDLGAGERVGIYLPKRCEAVSALFATSLAGGSFVPINPLLKPRQVAHILADCNVRVLVTTGERAALLSEALHACHDLHSMVLVEGRNRAAGLPAHVQVLRWPELLDSGRDGAWPRRIDADMAAILYTSGSTGSPKGVVLSHRNLLAGAESVAAYLGNHAGDRLLGVLPLSFDYGLSQLTTAFRVGARCVLLDYLLPRDVIRCVEREGITGLAAVPPLWVQLAQISWPAVARASLRYITNSGGPMPGPTLAALGRALPETRVFLMYGLTEAFRSTYLPPEELGRRPGSMGRAIPNAEVMVVREDGSPCAPGEPGELVHRGATVALGYWNDPPRTARRFRAPPRRPGGLVLPEVAVWSGDTVRADAEGYLYYVGRADDVIKTSGYRLSPTEVEEVLYADSRVSEAAVVGVPHPVLGQAVVAVVVLAAEEGPPPTESLVVHCRRELPGFMVPLEIVLRANLPRTPTGKLDRRALATELDGLFQEDET